MNLKVIKKATEKRRLEMETFHMKLVDFARSLRDQLEELPCEVYTSEDGQELEKIVENVEIAEGYAADCVARLYRAETGQE